MSLQVLVVLLMRLILANQACELTSAQQSCPWWTQRTVVGASVITGPCLAHGLVASEHNWCGPSHGTRSTAHHTPVHRVGNLPHGESVWSDTWGAPGPWWLPRTWTWHCLICIFESTSLETQAGLEHWSSTQCIWPLCIFISWIIQSGYSCWGYCYVHCKFEFLGTRNPEKVLLLVIL